jgi:hypothetical protein
MRRRAACLSMVVALVLTQPLPVFAWCSVGQQTMDRAVFDPRFHAVNVTALLLGSWLLTRLPPQGALSRMVRLALVVCAGAAMVLAYDATQHTPCSCFG